MFSAKNDNITILKVFRVNDIMTNGQFKIVDNWVENIYLTFDKSFLDITGHKMYVLISIGFIIFIFS